MSPQVLFPALRYDDARAAIDWLEKALGMEPGEVSESPEGLVVHAELTIAGATLMLGSNSQGGDVRLELPTGGGSVYIALQDAARVDELFARAEAAGADVLMPPTDQSYGSHEFSVADPEGNTWSVGTYRPTSDAAR